MRAGCIAPLQARLADGVRQVDEVQPVPGARLFEKAAHPLPVGQRVGGKVEHDRQAGAQQRLDMATHHLAQAARVAGVLGHRALFVAVERGQPDVLADQDRVGRVGQAPGQRRLAGGDLAANHMQRRRLRGQARAYPFIIPPLRGFREGEVPAQRAEGS